MRDTSSLERKVLTVKEVSDYLKIPISTIYNLAREGKLRAVKFGKHWRFLEEEILARFDKKV
jgi:excisionase family DNA binding protein